MISTELYIEALGTPKRIQNIFENRNYYEDNLEALFENTPKEDMPTVPSGLVAEIVDNIVSRLFPEGTSIGASEDSQIKDLVDSIVEDIQLLERLRLIATEGAVTGTVYLKSLPKVATSLVAEPNAQEGMEVPLKEVRSFTGKWSLSILIAEAVTIVTDPLDVENVEKYRIRFRFQDNNSDWFWWQEEWTESDYFEWLPQPFNNGEVPRFDDSTLNQDTSGPHDYGCIPITAIRHKLCCDSPYGESEIDEKLKRYWRAATISESKTEVAGQFSNTPMYAIINDKSRTHFSLSPHSVLRLMGDGEVTPDIKAIEHSGTPESVFKAQENLVDKSHRGAQVTSPEFEKEVKGGSSPSSVLYKAVNHKFIEKVKGLRVRYGDAGVEKHIEMILKMGARLGIPDYESINPDDSETYNVEMSYPPFFEATVAEKSEELTLLERSHLPSDVLAQRIAAMHGISNKDVIQQIQDNIELEAEERKALLAGVNMEGDDA